MYYEGSAILNLYSIAQFYLPGMNIAHRMRWNMGRPCQNHR